MAGLRGASAVLLGFLAIPESAPAGPAPSFSPLVRLTHREVLVRFSAPTRSFYQLDVSIRLTAWQAVLTGVSAGVKHFLDAGAPGAGSRFYRGRRVTEANNVIVGDHFPTSHGDLPFMMSVTDATNAVHEFRPRVIYPCHDRDQGGATTHAAAFKRLLGLIWGWKSGCGSVIRIP